MDALRDLEFWTRYYPAEPDEDGDGESDDGKLELRWPWDERHELALDLTSSSKELGLRDRTSGAWHSLGWWDDARWHPFCLRWAELEALVEGWEADPTREPRPPVPLLLLSCFVGFGVGDEAERAVAEAAVQGAFRALGFSADEASTLAGAALVPAPEPDYRWTRDPDLGWIFGGEYACYSIRNREHADGAEGRFPFEELRRRFGG